MARLLVAIAMQALFGATKRPRSRVPLNRSPIVYPNSARNSLHLSPSPLLYLRIDHCY
jgi:hypothetical protein